VEALGLRDPNMEKVKVDDSPRPDRYREITDLEFVAQPPVGDSPVRVWLRCAGVGDDADQRFCDGKVTIYKGSGEVAVLTLPFFDGKRDMAAAIDEHGRCGVRPEGLVRLGLWDALKKYVPSDRIEEMEEQAQAAMRTMRPPEAQKEKSPQTRTVKGD
jgi:hypothetical protein